MSGKLMWHVKVRAVAYSAFVAVALVVQVIRPSAASDSFYIYSPNTAIEHVKEIVAQIEADLQSPSERVRSEALSTMATLATSARFRPKLRPPPCGCNDPTPEFDPWSEEVLELLRNRFEAELAKMLTDAGSEEAMRVLPLAGFLGMDTTAYRTLARELLSSSDHQALIRGVQYYRGLGIDGVVAAMSMLPGESREERHSLFWIFRITSCEVDLPPDDRRALVGSLFEALHDPDSRVVSHALTSLNKMQPNPQRMAPILIKALMTGQGDAGHARALKCVPGVEDYYRSELLEIASSPDPLIRKISVEVLGRRSDGDSVLIAALQDTDHRVRSTAITMLGTREYPTDKYVPLLIECINMSRGLQFLTFTAVKECERLGATALDALPALTLLLTGIPHDHLRKDVLRAMVAVGGDCQTNLGFIRHYWKKNAEINRGDLIRILMMLGPAAVTFLGEIEEALLDPHGAPYRDTLKLCRALGPEASGIAPILVRGLHSDRRFIREETLDTLIALGPGLCLVREEIEAITWSESWAPELRTRAGVALLHSDCP